jgi:hypothetical protein
MTFGGFQSSWGKTFKYFSLKICYILAIFIFEVGSLLCAVAPDPIVFIVGRAIAGIGGAGVATGAYTIVAFSVEPKARAQFTGIVGATYGLASVCGPLLGGAFSENVTWRWCFYINLPIGGLACLLTLFFFHTPTAAKPVDASLREKFLQMDLVGTGFIMAGIISFILAMQYGGQTKSWHSPDVVGLLVGFVLIFIAFGVWEYFQGDRAMLLPRLIKRRSLWAGSLFQFFFAGSYFVILYYLPIYFQSVDDVSPIASGVRTLALIIPITFATVASGISITKTGHATPLVVVGSALAAVAAGLLYTLDLGTSAGKCIGYQILSGAAVGWAFQITMIMVQADAKSEDISSVTAILMCKSSLTGLDFVNNLNSVFQTIGGAFTNSAAQSGFVNKLISTLAITAPDVDPEVVVATGATQIRTSFDSQQVPGIVAAYMAAVRIPFAIAVATSGVAFLFTFAMNWKRLHAESLQEVGAIA